MWERSDPRAGSAHFGRSAPRPCGSVWPPPAIPDSPPRTARASRAGRSGGDPTRAPRGRRPEMGSPVRDRSRRASPHTPERCRPGHATPGGSRFRSDRTNRSSPSRPTYPGRSAARPPPSPTPRSTPRASRSASRPCPERSIPRSGRTAEAVPPGACGEAGRRRFPGRRRSRAPGLTSPGAESRSRSPPGRSPPSFPLPIPSNSALRSCLASRGVLSHPIPPNGTSGGAPAHPSRPPGARSGSTDIPPSG